MTAVEVPFGSPLYRAVRELRDAVLRRPLGLPMPEDFGPEDGFRHFALVDEKQQPVACAMAVPHEPGHWQIRQMAVRPERQRTGLGRQLLVAVEAFLRESGATHLHLHARDHAIDFYARLGYAAVGDPFTEIGIPHQRMEKRLAPARKS